MNNYQPTMPEAAYESLMGQACGSGGGREVFYVNGDSDVVIKRMRKAPHLTNVIEWTLWHQIASTNLSDMFAACFSISDSCKYLIMERLHPISEADYVNVPKLPEWFNDRKPENFGKTSAGTVKILDYAVLSLSSTFANAHRSLWAMTVAARQP